MRPPQNIVAATDFSLDARRASRRAGLIAQNLHLDLTLLHVVDSGTLTRLSAWFQGRSDVQAALEEHARAELTSAAHELRDQVGVEPKIEFRRGAPLRELADAAGAADLLVLGAKGSHPIRELAIGTTGARLLHKSPAPMLIVKTEPAEPYRRVLALIDFTSASETALRSAYAIAPRASYRLLHAFELPFENQLALAGISKEEIDLRRAAEREQALARMDDLLQELGIPEVQCALDVRPGDVRWRALDVMKEFGPDLLVVGKQGDSLIEDVFLGSVTRAMLAEVPCDILIAPPGAQASPTRAT